MSDPKVSEITQILQDWNNDVEGSKDKLLPFVYSELKKQARIFMSGERSNHTLQPTALVHEAFLRIDKQTNIEWKDRSHFYGIASRLMRQVLVEHARSKATKKRGANIIHFSIDDVEISAEERAYSIIALNDALEKLEKFDKKQCEIVEMRFFGGLTYEEIAKHFEVSDRTVFREWQAAKLWLYRELNPK